MFISGLITARQPSPHVTITHDALDLTAQRPPTPQIRHRSPTSPPTTDIWCRFSFRANPNEPLNIRPTGN